MRRWRSWPGGPAPPTRPGARLLAEELGRLPLALAQAAAVIAAQHLDYATYLRRLRAKPVDQLLLRDQHERVPAWAGGGGAAGAGRGPGRGRHRGGSAVMDLVSVLSAAGVPRSLLHAAGQAGALGGQNGAGGRGWAGGGG